MRKFSAVIIGILLICSCKTPSGVFSKKTSHEQYSDKIDKLGLKQTALGNRWFDAAEKAFINPVAVQLPYKENGYFPADLPLATGLRFEGKRGDRLTVELTKIPAGNYLLFADLFSLVNGTTTYIQSVDTISNRLQYTLNENTVFILRLQPELLQSSSYTIDIRTGPSLAFPIVSPTSKNRVISVWGDGRDKGVRKHEGVDIGGTFRTPVVAIGDGYVSRVTENTLGGKVVFINADNSNESWYYAHLDSQIATSGQRVKAGDIIGLIGNTGNARTTAPHLHFGIYTSGGAIDPLPFIDPVKKESKSVTAPASVLGKQMKISGRSPLTYDTPDLTGKEKAVENIPVMLIAATGNLYKAFLPGGEIKFIPAANITGLEKNSRQLVLNTPAKLMDAPNMDAPVIQTLPARAGVDVLGRYGKFQYVAANGKYGWISQ